MTKKRATVQEAVAATGGAGRSSIGLFDDRQRQPLAMTAAYTLPAKGSSTPEGCYL